MFRGSLLDLNAACLANTDLELSSGVAFFFIVIICSSFQFKRRAEIVEAVVRTDTLQFRVEPLQDATLALIVLLVI